jgi:hypothetical protein
MADPPTNGIPEMWNSKRAAAELRARGVVISATTLDNERRAEQLGCIEIGKRHYYTLDILLAYIARKTVPAKCPEPELIDSANLENTGSPNIPNDQTATGAGPGTIPQDDRRAVSALAQQTFLRRQES